MLTVFSFFRVSVRRITDVVFKLVAHTRFLKTNMKPEVLPNHHRKRAFLYTWHQPLENRIVSQLLTFTEQTFCLKTKYSWDESANSLKKMYIHRQVRSRATLCRVTDGVRQSGKFGKLCVRWFFSPDSWPYKLLLRS